MKIKVLFIGDVVGRAGRRALKMFLPQIKREYSPDFVIANVENAAGTSGITLKVYEEIKGAGVDIMTSGNHIFAKKEVFNFIDESDSLLRPLNFPEGVPGKGFNIYRKDNKEIAVLSVIGRVFLGEYDCPIRETEKIIKEIKEIPIIIDFHGEVTSEKIIFADYFDGKALAIIGTHTHVQTKDLRILNKGTLFISDIGMTGSFDSIIGVEKEAAFKRLRYLLPAPFDAGKEKIGMNSLYFEFDSLSKKILYAEIINKGGAI
ncbi:MAG: TIGR00282 family metallophosphoesterase [candidate division WOR-3 bacterium]